MDPLEELFTYGNITKEVQIKNVTFKLVPLSSKKLLEALSAAPHLDGNAQNIEYKKQILSRSIVSINGNKQFEDELNPTNEEITKLGQKIEKFHVSVLNKIYEAYDELDEKVGKEVAEEVKK